MAYYTVTPPLIAAMGGVAGSALGALGQTSGSQGYTYGTSSSSGFNFTDGASANEFSREMMLAQQQYNSAEALKNRAWQEYMSGSAYQRSVEDLKRAGLNPVLAALNGGASMGAGSQASSGLATGVASSYGYNESASSNYGIQSAQSYSNFAKALEGLTSGISSMLGGVVSGLGNAVQQLPQVVSTTAKAVANSPTLRPQNKAEEKLLKSGNLIGYINGRTGSIQ